jgi:hypothetical protein
MPRSAVPVMASPASAVIAFAMTLGSMPLGLFFSFFFGFDFFAEFLFFGVPASAFFAFAVDFFDGDRFVFVLAGFAVVRFGFVVLVGEQDGGRGWGWQGRGVRGRGCGKQQQRGEQEHQQDREFPHGSYIGAERGSA